MDREDRCWHGNVECEKCGKKQEPSKLDVELLVAAFMLLLLGGVVACEVLHIPTPALAL